MLRHRLASLAALLLATALDASAAVDPAAALSAPVHERVLGNGLKVLVKPDDRAPIVTSQVWYKVGSSYEHGGITGVSHALEHMMFKGTERLEPGEFSRIIARNGGDENAFTGRDYTAYFQTLAADRLEVAFELEADRMRHLALPAEEFAKEIEVVKEERRLRTDDDPKALTFEQFNATAYAASPYRNPIIGWPSDLDSMSVETLRDWYRMWYAPNNATLVVVGDVEPDAVFALAEKHFGPLQPGPALLPRPRQEPPQHGEKRLRVSAPAKEPYLLMGWKTPALRDAETPWEPYALEMLVSVLDGGDSSRFSRELVREQRVAASAGASYNAFSRLSGMLVIDGTPAKGKSIETLEQALLAQVERLKTEPVSEQELSRIRRQLIAGKVYERDSVFYQAMLLGQFETVGLGWELVDQYVDRLSEVTPEQIQTVANRYLTTENRSVARLEPEPIADDAAQAATLSQLGGGHVH
ncbi:M16 family metallopeptidase [Halochromatium glycolicum]|uniref:Peptidase M16 n=1 Tax=Halochromatium glycolicum TaxID=85075 RepID=A0AAJ0U876_9GAMM|nr:pitrilysin family protein [Halochromatium glycolicum]MBK1707123.1 peptidase M16 [Halochromatium glycolicum]